MGDGIGGTEKKLGVAANREECINMVKIREPNANGATFPNSAGPGNCYAEFGMSRVNANEKYQTCLFSGMSLFDNLNKFKILFCEISTIAHIIFFKFSSQMIVCNQSANHAKFRVRKQ